MLKRISVLAILMLIIITMIPVFADAMTGPEVYQITVTEDGGKYQFGNIEVFFKKDFLEKDFGQVTFTVSIYAENGVPFIQFDPSVEQFAKKVMIKVKKGSMNFYDTITGETINIQLDNYTFNVEHFSRYIVID